MKYIGLHMGHDAAVAVFNETGDLEFYSPCERYSPRLKMHGLTLAPTLSSFPEFTIEERDCVSVTMVQKMRPVDGYDPRLVQRADFAIHLGDSGCVPNFVLDHHFCHALASWCFRDDDRERLFLAYDGCGHSLRGRQKSSLVGLLSPDGFSYVEGHPILSSVHLFNLLGPNSAGKAMGMAGFRPHAPSFLRREYLKQLLDISVNWNDGNVGCPRANIASEEDMDFVASFYRFVIEEIWSTLKLNIDCYAGGRGVVLGGGSALALEVNTKVAELVTDVVFGPPVNDTGLAIGAAAFSFFHHHKFWPKIDTPSLVSLQEDLPQVGPSSPADIARLIADNRVVGLLRGKAEAGPRALGFRSLLADPRNKSNLVRVSQTLKGREYYRPLSPIVTSDQFNRFFIGPQGAYMQYRVDCTTEAQRLLPAIVHTDNSARPQVVYESRDPWLYKLLKHFGEFTGVECMINTSLNRAGKPICNTYRDAVEDFPSGVEIVSIPTPRTSITPGVAGSKSPLRGVPFELRQGNYKVNL